MADKIVAQGVVPVKRLRDSDTLTLTLEGNGKPLFQAVDTEAANADGSAGVVPDWSKAENQPVLTPKCVSARGNAVVLSMHQWEYLGTAVNFNGASSGGWTTSSDGRFQMNTATGALKIVKNLASKTNIANDSLRYKCVATVAGVEFSLEITVDVVIQPAGSAAYIGTLWTNNSVLDETHASTVINSTLYIGQTTVSDYTVKWEGKDGVLSGKDGKTLTVTRDMVDSNTLFVANFYRTGSSTPCYRAGIRIADTADIYAVQTAVDGNYVTATSGVKVTATVVNVKTNSAVTLKNASWVATVYYASAAQSGTTGAEIKTIRTEKNNQVTITSKDTDILENGKTVLRDVNVNFSVEGELA